MKFANVANNFANPGTMLMLVPGIGLYLGEGIYYSMCNTFLIVLNTCNGILAAAIGLQILDSNLR
jgi:hypothetical protein